MSKGIIVMDIPEYCDYCPVGRMFGFDSGVECLVAPEGQCVSGHGFHVERPDWCPIKPLPDKLPEHEPVAYKDNDNNWVNRMKRLPEHCDWNACLDVILED